MQNCIVCIKYYKQWMPRFAFFHTGNEALWNVFDALFCFINCMWHNCHKMSRLMTKPTKWHVRPAKTQISLGLIRVVAVRMKKAWVLIYPFSTQRRLLSAWADAQAELILRWAHSYCVGFIMRRLRCLLAAQRRWEIYPSAKLLFELYLSAYNIVIISIFSYISRSMIKQTNWPLREAKTQISLGTRPFWLESSLCAQWTAMDLRLLRADSEDSDQTGPMPRLIWVFAASPGCTGHFDSFTMLLFKFFLHNKNETEGQALTDLFRICKWLIKVLKMCAAAMNCNFGIVKIALSCLSGLRQIIPPSNKISAT